MYFRVWERSKGDIDERKIAAIYSFSVHETKKLSSLSTLHIELLGWKPMKRSMLDLQKKREKIRVVKCDWRYRWEKRMINGDEIPFDVNVIGNREDYNFYVYVKKM